ncbi:MAG: (1-_4)-alpha-D-glucan 1-alpha-D-glucosylmutase, partial [Actinomycetota bacterium]|nr:(1->4)-alpha-D-glucan 1-alpha-D-glucosylmutase [Actinomycetota bacterium]
GASEDELTDFYASFTGASADLGALTHEKKMLIMRRVMAGDIARLTREFLRTVDPWGADPDDAMDEARVALAEVIAALHVYRTYVLPDGSAHDSDETILRDASASARDRAPHVSPVVFDRVEEALLTWDEPKNREFLMRFQQATGPIMAKGVEDTVFYNFNRFVALNEVGGDPGAFGTKIGDFHDAASRASAGHPLSMLGSSTHDTKRSEDVRARLAVLAEIPGAWAAAVERWSQMAARHRQGNLPDRNTEYLLWQTLVGAWPLDAERVTSFLTKAMREAKRYTSWLDQKPAYENATLSFTRSVMGDEDIVDDIRSFVAPLISPGRVNSLTQTLIKLTYPGVPDTYQGTELWNLSLVDPDNRRPVDYELRRDLLKQALTVEAAEAWERADEGLPKMFLIARALDLRARRPQAFGKDSPYEAIPSDGALADRIVGYTRAGEVAVVVPRLPLTTQREGWGDTVVELPPGRWRDEFTEADFSGGRLSAPELLSAFPVALLVRS